MKNNTKEWIQYSSAISMIVSGIILAFLSFFLNNYSIEESILVYIAQALIYAGGIFGVSIYFKNKIGEFNSTIKDKLTELLDYNKNSE